jgi:hypothetical protein
MNHTNPRLDWVVGITKIEIMQESYNPTNHTNPRLDWDYWDYRDYWDYHTIRISQSYKSLKAPS